MAVNNKIWLIRLMLFPVIWALVHDELHQPVWRSAAMCVMVGVIQLFGLQDAGNISAGNQKPSHCAILSQVVCRGHSH